MSVDDALAKGVSGAIGVAPPPDAPQETAQPLTPDAIAVMQARAAANERTLAPFNPTGPRVQPAPAAPAATTTAPAPKTIRRVARPSVDPEDPAAVAAAAMPSLATASAGPDPERAGLSDAPLAGDLPQIAAVAETSALPPLTDEERARMPAASDTEDPARGKPAVHPGQLPKDKQITGGFSDAMDAQYFPLDGAELLQLVLGLFDTLAEQLPRDLRFSMALAYPRVRARVRVEVEGHAEDNNSGFVIEKLIVPADGTPGSTPIEVARARAREVVFVVDAMRQEVAPDGESDQPPDAIRDELGLTKPQKTMLTDEFGHRVIVDRVMTLPTDTTALTGGGR